MADQLSLFTPERSLYVGLKICLVCGGRLDQRYRGPDVPLFTYVMARQDWVKIGMSRHPEVRLKELRAINRQRYIITPTEMDCAQPIELLHTWLGDMEHLLHERWAACHAAGEWFLPDKEMRTWLNAGGSAPAIPSTKSLTTAG